MRAPSPRGIVLLLVTGIVTLLALLAVLFVVTTRSVSIMARTTLEGARAHLLSRAGVEYAAARLGRSLSIPAAPTAANRTDDWTFRDDPRLPLGACHNPSYAHGEMFLDAGTLDGRYAPPPGSPDGFDPALHDRDGSGFHSAWTGRLRGTYAPFGDTFTLRIRDANGRIDLNLPDDAGPAPGPGRFGRVMDQLGVAIAAADGVPDPIAGRGADIAARRAALPGGRFTRIEEMIGPPPGGLTDAEWAAVRPYVAVGAPVDPDVVSPLWDASGQINGVQVQGRPPVSLASAEPAVLEALFGVSGDAEKVVGFNADDMNPSGSGFCYRNPMTRVTASLPPATARALAAAVISRRATDPFETWAEWRSWLRTLPAGITEIQADLVDAATNPNTLLNKFNPDPVALRRFDKLDVTLPTTELSLMPRGGFDVEALGLVRFDGGAVFAAANVRASLRVARTVCLTTQAHFEAAGTERVGVVTLPEPIAMPGTVPSPWDGQVVLARAADTEGADPLHVPLQTGLDALDESPVPADFPPSAETFGPSVFDTGGVGPGFFRGSQVTPLAGLYLWQHYADSVLSGNPQSTWAGYAFAGLPNAPWEGPASQEVWFKPVWRSNDRSLWAEDLIAIRHQGIFSFPPGDAFIRLRLGLLVRKSGWALSVYRPTPTPGFASVSEPWRAEDGWGSSARRWHHLMVSWQVSGENTEFNVFVDGRRADTSPLKVLTADYRTIDEVAVPDPTQYVWSFGANPYVPPNASSSEPLMHRLPFHGSYGRIIVSDAAYRPEYFVEGFTPHAIYETSDPSLPPPLAHIDTAPVPIPDGARLLDMSYTSYTPSGTSLSAALKVGADPWMAAVDTGGAPTQMNLLLAGETDPILFPGMTLVRCRANLIGSSVGTPCLETPYLDDLTLRYTPPGGPVLTGYVYD